jgi:hypothetical protein
MRSSDYGPVPISRVKEESDQIYEALAKGRRVLISRRGAIDSVIDPVSDVPDLLTLSYMVPSMGPVLEQCSATDVGQGNLSERVRYAVDEHPVYFTKDRNLYGILRGIDRDELEAEFPSEEAAEAEAQFVADYLSSDEAQKANPAEVREAVRQARQSFHYFRKPSAASVGALRTAADGYIQTGDSDLAIRGCASALLRIHAQAGPRHHITLLARQNLATTMAMHYGPNPILAEIVENVSVALAVAGDAHADEVRANARALASHTTTSQWADADDDVMAIPVLHFESEVTA